MTIKQATGSALVASPFLIVFGVGVASMGWLATALALLSVTGVVAVVYAGIWLLNEE